MSSGDNTDERNPFAPPPANAPDRPWQPRTPQPPAGKRPDGTGGTNGTDDSDNNKQPGGEQPPTPPGHPWSPGYQGEWHPQPAQQPKFDSTDPAQRRARNALVAGMASLICVLGAFHYLALLLGGIAVYWGVSALRSAPKTPPRDIDTPEPATPPATRPSGSANPQAPAAVGGLFTGAVSVLVAAVALALSLYYQDYRTCVRDALTTTAAHSCDNLAPKWYTNIVNRSS